MRRQYPEQQAGWVKDLFACLDAESIERLRKQSRHYELHEGETVPHVQESLVRVDSGLLKMTLVGEDRQFTVGLYGPNDTIVSPMFHPWEPSLYVIEAQEPTEAWVIPQRAALELAAEQPEFSRCLMRHLSWNTWHLMHTAQTLAFYTLPQRIARVLVNLVAMFGVQTERGMQLGLRITQKELAELAGARRETLSTVLQDLRDDDVLDLRYARVGIKNMDLLRELAATDPLPFLKPREVPAEG
jgi:CRP-like cAMP-binding protein